MIHSLLLQGPGPAVLWRSQPQHWMTNPGRLILRRYSAARPTWCHHSFLRINILTSCLPPVLPLQPGLGGGDQHLAHVWFVFFFPGCREDDLPEEWGNSTTIFIIKYTCLLLGCMCHNFFLTYEKQEPGASRVPCCWGSPCVTTYPSRQQNTAPSHPTPCTDFQDRKLGHELYRNSEHHGNRLHVSPGQHLAQPHPSDPAEKRDVLVLQQTQVDAKGHQQEASLMLAS